MLSETTDPELTQSLQRLDAVLRKMNKMVVRPAEEC